MLLDVLEALDVLETLDVIYAHSAKKSASGYFSRAYTYTQRKSVQSYCFFLRYANFSSKKVQNYSIFMVWPVIV